MLLADCENRESGRDARMGESALSVSAAMSLAKGALEGITVRIVGEVSEFNCKSGYKAVYFTVKDEKAALPCMMWMNRFNAAGLNVNVGMLVELTGRFTLYAAKGRMNFDVFSMHAAGEGDLRLKVASLARKLAAEGLTDASRKLPLPEYPERIGLVTSPRGAAVHDVLRTLRRRFPLAQVLVCGVPVEGANAPAGLIEGLRRCASEGAQAVLLVRGGGSFEDLMPFNDESLARAIADLPVPVVTGIGHEPDTTIADLVADVRASTPTAAAEAVSPDAMMLAADLFSRAASMADAMHARTQRLRVRVDACASRPVLADPHTLFQADALHLDANHERLASIGRRLIEPHRSAMALRASRLNDLSPLAVIGRGYGMVQDAGGSVLQSVEKIARGDGILVVLRDGRLECTVEDIVRND